MNLPSKTLNSPFTKPQLASLLPLYAVTITFKILQNQLTTAFFPQRQITSFLKTLFGREYGELSRDERWWIEAAQSGYVDYIHDDLYRFTVFCGPGGYSRLRELLVKVSSLPTRFDSKPRERSVFYDNIECAEISDYFGDYIVTHHDAAELTPYTNDNLLREIEYYQDEHELIIDLISPHRLSISKDRQKKLGLPCAYIYEMGQFQQNQFLRKVFKSLENLGIASGTAAIHENAWLIEHEDVFWVDNNESNGSQKKKSSKEHRPAFGGLLGRIRLTRQEENTKAITALILGQYFGIGEMRSYGYGRYRLLRGSDNQCARPLAPPCQSIIERATSRHVLEEAYKKVTNSKHPDFDLISSGHYVIEQKNTYWQDNTVSVDYIRKILADKHNIVQPLTGAIMRQQGKKPRPLAIPSVTERVLQRAILDGINPSLNRIMYDSSYGYRKGRSRLNIADKIKKLVRDGYLWCFEADIASFFDCVPFSKIETRLRSLYPCDEAVDLIMQWVRAPVVYEGHVITRQRGLPQGAPLSPLLANILLSDFDSDCLRHDLKCLRYADDFIVLCKKRSQAEYAQKRAQQSLAEIGLSLKPSKTRIIKVADGFKFLGYTIVNDMVVEQTPQHLEAKTLIEPNDIPEFSWLAKLIKNEPPLLKLINATPKTTKKDSIRKIHANIDNEFGRVLIISGSLKHLSRQNRKVVIYDQQSEARYLEQIYALSSVVIIGTHHITTPLLSSLMYADVPVHFISAAGRYIGQASSSRPTREGHTLWLKQNELFADEKTTTFISKQLVEVRINNQLKVLHQRKRTNMNSAERVEYNARYRNIGLYLRRLKGATNKNSIRAMEANATREYYRALNILLPNAFRFSARTSHPALTPFCALLDFGYSILRSYTASITQVCGLYSWMGYYHIGYGKHHALASDQMEPFRHIVERTALTLVKQKQLSTDEFFNNEFGYSRLTSNGRKIYFNALMKSFNEKRNIPHVAEAFNMAELIHRQNCSLVAHIRNTNKPLWFYRI